MKLCGVYQIVNLKTNKVYIGSSCDIYTRWKQHLQDLQNGTHCNAHLQHSFTLYGENNFTFSIVELCESSKLIEREQYYLDLVQSYNPQIGYNIRKIAYGHSLSPYQKYKLSIRYKGRGNPNFGRPVSEATKAKLRLAHLGNRALSSEESKNRFRSTWYSHNMSSVIINNMKNAIILYDNSDCTVVEVANLFNIPQYQLSRALRGEEYKFLHTDKRVQNAVKRYMNGTTTKRNRVCIAIYTAMGNFVTLVESVKEASVYTKVDMSNISASCREEQRVYKGYMFRKITNRDNIPQKIIAINSYTKRCVNLYDLYGKYIATFSSQKEAALEFDIPASEISTVLSGKKTHYSNYRFGWFLDNPMCYDIDPDFAAIEMIQKLKKKPLKFYQIIDEDNVMYSESIHDAARLTGCNRANINNVLNGKIPHTKGYVFEFVNQ